MYAQTFETIDSYSSEDTPSESSDDEAEQYTKQTHFMNMTTLDEYEKNRDKLFTKDILRKRIVIDLARTWLLLKSTSSAPSL